MDKSDLDVLSDVVKRATDIQQILSLTNIKGANYLLEYKLIDFMQILSLVKKCPKCNEYFFPNPTTKRLQVYCGAICRNKATNENKYVKHLDEYQRPVDLLRKNIYERRYRAQRDGKYFNEADYQAVLKRLKALVKQKDLMSRDEYFNKLDDITKDYELAVKAQKYGYNNNI